MENTEKIKISRHVIFNESKTIAFRKHCILQNIDDENDQNISNEVNPEQELVMENTEHETDREDSVENNSGDEKNLDII
ncbi:hypothetical protein WA026_017090 [Henosepilachna vigintioctopunctata]|uniref:Uncharacterized protein n=1 Tax=Henosepilachna vigintioctopunctata TaxID=420089 RepID=A0AAW1TPQ1_9CUCU